MDQPMLHPLRSLSLPSPITSLVFDPHADLLHVPQQSHLLSLHSLACVRYASVHTHPSAVVVDDRSVYSLSSSKKQICATHRSGLTKWVYDMPSSSSSYSITTPFNPISTHSTSSVLTPQPVFCSSTATELTLCNDTAITTINTGTGTALRTTTSPFPISFVSPSTAHPAAVVIASSSGKICAFDTRAPSIASSSPILVHTGGLSLLQTSSHHALTLGFSLKAGRPHPDHTVHLFDLRAALRPCASVHVPLMHSPPSIALFHPRDNSKILLVSPDGAVALTDSSNPTDTQFQMIAVSDHISAAAYNSSADILALGESNGVLHLLSTVDPSIDPAPTGSFLPRNVVGRPLEYPPPPQQNPAQYEFWEMTDSQTSQNTPLNLVGMPHYTTPLLSNFPSSLYAPKLYSPLFQNPKRIPQDIQDAARVVDGIGYVKINSTSSLRGVKRNQICAAAHAISSDKTGGNHHNRGSSSRRPHDNSHDSSYQKSSPKSATEPKFRSEQKFSQRHVEDCDDDEASNEASKVVQQPLSKGQIPRHYRKVEIKYSRFGIEDFDFGFYNKTKFSGLETHIANSYANSLLQAIHYVRPLREISIAHTREACNRENCLLCETGFLSRMLQDAKGINCQAANFSRALSLLPQCHALGLVDGLNEDASTKQSNLVQTLHRFLIGQFSIEASFFPLEVPFVSNKRVTESVVTQLCGINTITTNVCSCKDRTTRKDTIHVIDLVYSRKGLSNEPPIACDFPTLLNNSIARDTNTKHTCSKCQAYTALHSRRALSEEDGELPPVLCVNAAAHTQEQLSRWAAYQSLPPKIMIKKTNNGEIEIIGSSDSNSDSSEYVTYILRSVVQQIQTKKDVCHLICVSRVDDHESKSHKWMMFNDFLVKELSEEEALSLSDPWKSPCVLLFERQDSDDILNYDALPHKIDTSILTESSNIAWNHDPRLQKHRILTENELPMGGSKVAIDAEFVEMQQEELEFRPDGNKAVLRPSRLGLARISVLRGDADSDIKPFVDDYIHTSEPVVDYLTEFSGILHGDLDPSTSKHTLVTRKMAYKKIRLLLDLGCIFVGHGLYNDFRIINIFVPSHQIVDTVDIYAKKNQSRKLSLKFLSWYVLKEDIQTDTHDSIEDARGALLLYRHYLKLQADDIWNEFLEELFRKGRLYNFRPTNTHSTGQMEEPFTPPQGHKTPSILSPAASSQLNTPSGLPRSSSWASIAMG